MNLSKTFLQYIQNSSGLLTDIYYCFPILTHVISDSFSLYCSGQC